MARRILIGSLCAAAAGGLLLFPRIHHTQLAKSHQYIAQAVCDYQADHGLYPEELKDLVPAYLPTVPASIYSDSVLYIHTGLPHTYVIYSFRPGGGWYSAGDFGVGKLAVPSVSPSHAPLTGQKLVRARLQEYDKRIANGSQELHFRAEKICYLLSLKRTADAYEECRLAVKAHPDWWRPRMGLATLAPPAEAAGAEAAFKGWIDKHPAFIRYWYLARYFKDRGRPNEALAALRQGVKYPLVDVDPDSMWVPEAFAFDAASFACQRNDPSLVLAVTKIWAGPDRYAFSAAAKLALGRLDEAKKDVEQALAEARAHAIWAGNLQDLATAIERGNRSFVYDPGALCCGSDWTLFPAPDE